MTELPKTQHFIYHASASIFKVYNIGNTIVSRICAAAPRILGEAHVLKLNGLWVEDNTSFSNLWEAETGSHNA